MCEVVGFNLVSQAYRPIRTNDRTIQSGIITVCLLNALYDKSQNETISVLKIISAFITIGSYCEHKIQGPI